MKPPMSPEPPLSRAEEIFLSLLEIDPPQREAALARACEGDEDLKAEIRALLAAHESAPAGFLSLAGTASGDDAEATLAAGPRAGRGRPTFPSSERPGDRIGPYKLLQKIGEGGFGVVWMAEQEQPLRRRVALKIIKLGMDTREVVSRFEQERQALAMMDHPNIARVIDGGATEQGRPFFVMELVRGVRITDYCDEQSLTTTERIELFIQVCHAVQHAHQKGVIHRDLKPSNLLVTINDGAAVAKVIDFGVAKATIGRLTDGTLFTQFEQMIGTPLYMSPEQAEMTSLDVDTRSDIYSLGVLLYELLTGRTPIDGATMAKAGMDEIRRLIREVDPLRPSQRIDTLDGNERTTAAKRRHTDAAKLPSALRGDLDWIVMKCLEKDRKRRYDTANGLALDLRRHLENEIVTARPPTTAYLLGKLIRRNKVAFAAGLAITASLVVGIAASVWQAVRATQAEHRAVAAFDELRATAPAFADQARSLAAKEQYGEAIEKLDYAIKLRPDDAEFLVQKADLLQCQFRLAEAATIYREALALQPDHARAEASAKLCDELLAAPTGPDGKLTRESLGKLHIALQKQQRPAAELLPAARLLGAEREHLIAYWLERLKDLPISPEKPLKDRLTVREDDLLELDLKGTQMTDLAVLAGMPLGKLTLWSCRQIPDFTPLREFRSLTYLDLDDTQIADLSVLSGLPLEELYIGGTKVSDLSPLRGLKLKKFGIYGGRLISDLRPLEGMPLNEFYASGLANGTDFSPLKSLPLEKCLIESSSVVDLSLLAATPLKELGIYHCSQLRGLGWLNDIKSLERLVLPGNYRQLPDEDIRAIAALRAHPRLQFIQGDANEGAFGGWRVFQVTQSKEIFWRDWDREQTFLPAIREAGLDFTLTKLPDETYRLRIQEQPLRDLSFLKGAPISELYIGGTQVTDLSPIADLPLRLLEFTDTDVTDLSPLRKLRLEELMLGRGAVPDLSLLTHMPLRRLYMHCAKSVGDLSPLVNLQTLQSLTVAVTARNIESLKDMKSLQWLGFRGDTRDAAGSTPVGLFWERWPAMAWSRALNESGVDYSAYQHADGLWTATVKSREFRDCGIFKGAAIRELTLSDTSVSDLSPLVDIPLTKLDLRRTQVSDLSPLRSPTLGGSLRHLVIRQCNIDDFTPLADCASLEVLDVSDTALTDADLSLLRGRKLDKLEIQFTKVTELSALAGMPLTVLRLEGTAVTDLSPLLSCPRLLSLVLPQRARNVSVLRDLPALGALSFTATSNGSPEQKAAGFWKEYDEAGWRTALREAGIVPKTLKQLDDGTWEVNLESSKISDLSPLRGAPISKLRLSKTAVRSLSPLRGLPLVELWLNSTEVKDLGPLQDMRIQILSIGQTPVTDLTALEGMPLEKLHAGDTDISDLTPLIGMPLTELRLRQCMKIADLSPIAGCGSLVSITLPPHAKDIEFLRHLTKLERISFSENAAYLPDQTAEEFWRDRDTERALSSIPGGAGRFKKLEGGGWELDLNRTGITDLSILSGVPVTSLNLGDTAVADLTPLRKLPLERLTLFDTQVADLSPLEGMQISELNLRGTQVADLSPLRGMPLASLRLQDSAVTDLSPLADCKTLVTLVLSTSAKEVEFLRSFPNLERLSYEARVDGLPRQSAEEFWKEYDALAWLRASGLSYGRARMLPDGSLDIDFHSADLSDLAVLHGKRISRLGLGNTAITELSPLRGMLLTYLLLYNTEVTDLSPLAGMPLENLSISGTEVTDISVLRGMPLTKLRMHYCKKLTDLSPLADAKDLAQITLPRNAKDIVFLRDPDKFPKLRRISFVENQATREPDKTAEQFWQEYDARKKP